MTHPPSPNGANGRDRGGRFAKGNPGGPGNPHGRVAAALRAAMLGAVSPEDMREIVHKLVELAKGGNITAAKEILDRCLGRPVEADLLEQLDALEAHGARGQRPWQR